MPYPELKAILTDIGTEELAHLEMVSTIVYQLTRNLDMKEVKDSGFGSYFVDHTACLLYTSVIPHSPAEDAFTGFYRLLAHYIVLNWFNAKRKRR